MTEEEEFHGFTVDDVRWCLEDIEGDTPLRFFVFVNPEDEEPIEVELGMAGGSGHDYNLYFISKEQEG